MGMKKGQTNKGSFKKGEHRSRATEFKKGQRLSKSTEFKKGQKPWNKGLTVKKDNRLSRHWLGKKMPESRKKKISETKKRLYKEGKIKSWNKSTIEDMQKLAKSKGGKFLSKKYLGAHTNQKWECSKGHQWKASPTAVKSSTWCPHCAGNVPHTIEAMQKLAESRKGKCLSKKYVRGHENLTWECSKGHKWEATAINVKRSTWCPYCSAYTGERICRKFFELIFKKSFRKNKPSWLRNSRGYKMELDGYSNKLGIAFEYHGQQHYHFNTRFHKTKKVFEQRKKDDNLKRKLCKEHDVKLIEIPYIVKFENMGDYIIKICKTLGIKLPKQTSKFNYRMFDIYSDERLKEMKEIAESKGGKCLSKEYIGSNIHLKWKCSEGHEWIARPYNIKTGYWCPKCSNRKTIEDMQKMAKARGGKCLSKKYIDSKTKLKWECSKGHQWETKPTIIQQDHWCPKCGNKKKL